MSPAEAQIKRLKPIRVLVQQVAEVRRRFVGGRNRQEHRCLASCLSVLMTAYYDKPALCGGIGRAMEFRHV